MSVYAKDGHSGELRPMRTAPIARNGVRRLTGLLKVDQLAKVAAVYGAAVDEGRPPTKAVAAALEVSHSRAANLVHEARVSGQLTVPPSNGRRPTS